MNAPATRTPRFVIVTPAHDEAALIGATIDAMLAQSLRPSEWIIVDDGSSDGTAAVVRRHAAGHDFIRLVQRERRGERGFGHKAQAFHAGLAATGTEAPDFVGNLDADITLPPDYFAGVLAAFAADGGLGIAGGMVETRIGTRYVSQNVAPDSVAGAVQLFRRTCFEDVGGYRPLPEGGIDSAAEIIARMKGWRVRTLAELRVREQRRTGSASATPLAARLKEGARLQSLGYGLAFVCLRCVRRALERPMLIGSAATLLGYLRRLLTGRPAALPPEVVRYLRSEQHRKLLTPWRTVHHVRHLRHP